MREVAQRLPMLTRAWRQLADAVLAEFRVSNSTAWCLIWIDRLGPDVRLTELAQAVGITQPSTVRVVDQLEAGGLARREQDPDDRRSNRILLTQEGRDLVSKIEERLDALRRELFDGIDDADIATVLRITDILADRIAGRRG